MARTPIDAASIRQMDAAQPLTVIADAADFVGDAGDEVNGNDTPCTGKELLLVLNTDVGAQTVTIDAAADSVGRDGAITTYSIGADEVALFGPFPTAIFRQTDNMLHIDVSDPAVELFIWRMP